MAQYRLTTVNRLGEGLSRLFDAPETAWSEWEAADKHRNIFRYASLIDLHDGRVMALFADGGVVPQSMRRSAADGASSRHTGQLRDEQNPSLNEESQTNGS